MSHKTNPSAEEFLKNVAEHKMTISVNNGVNRILRFSRPNSSTYYFDIITWKGKLCISGDMGTWVFWRLEDMFEFFRSSELILNTSYWAEKLINGVDRGGGSGAEEFSQDKFKEQIMYQVGEWINAFDEDEKEEFIKNLEEDVLNKETKESAQQAAYSFEHDGEYPFVDDVPSGMIYKFHFIWCLYAIVWAIQQYDELKEIGK